MWRLNEDVTGEHTIVLDLGLHLVTIPWWIAENEVSLMRVHLCLVLLCGESLHSFQGGRETLCSVQLGWLVPAAAQDSYLCGWLGYTPSRCRGHPLSTSA